MPKVLFLSPSSSLRGGVETILHELCRELPKRGWSPVLGLASGGHFNDAARYEAVNPGLPVHRIVPRRLTRRARVEAVIDAVRTVEPDVVVCARIADAYEAVARLKLMKSRPRLAVAVRGLGAQELHDLSYFQHFVDACIVDGRLVAEACVAIGGIERERVFSVPGGVHAPVGPVTPRVPRPELNVGYVGRIADADKRVLDLIELVRLLEQADLPYKLSIVGEGPDLPALKAALARPERATRIAFLGWRSRARAIWRDTAGTRLRNKLLAKRGRHNRTAGRPDPWGGARAVAVPRVTGRRRVPARPQRTNIRGRRHKGGRASPCQSASTARPA